MKSGSASGPVRREVGLGKGEGAFILAAFESHYLTSLTYSTFNKCLLKNDWRNE